MKKLLPIIAVFLVAFAGGAVALYLTVHGGSGGGNQRVECNVKVRVKGDFPYLLNEPKWRFITVNRCGSA